MAVQHKSFVLLDNIAAIFIGDDDENVTVYGFYSVVSFYSKSHASHGGRSLIQCMYCTRHSMSRDLLASGHGRS
jgi:hypothetical protein